MKLFLTSSVHAVAHDIVKRVDLSKGKKLVFIDTASEPVDDDKEWLANDRKALVNAGFDVTDLTITGKTKKELEEDLVEYDYIYMSGGDTPYLLEQSSKTGFIEVVRDQIIKQEKTYIGTSAGSIIAGPKIPDYLYEYGVSEEDKKNAYGFVNFTIVPHWGQEFFKERYLKKRLKIAYRDDHVPLIVLTDNQYVIVEEGKIEIIDVRLSKRKI